MAHPSPTPVLNLVATATIACGGVLAVSGAFAVLAWPLTGWAMPEALTAPTATVLGGVIATALGIGLILRGISLRIGLRTLALLAERAAPATAPSPPIRWEAQRVDPEASARMGDVQLARPQIVPLRDQAPVGTAGQGVPPVPPARPSVEAPVTGKPFQPHPIFMAPPPRPGTYPKT